MKFATKLGRFVKSRTINAETIPSAEPFQKEKPITVRHPYVGLPDRSYWKTGVASLSPLSLTDFYRKKFDINLEDRIVTAGSCFAQHIARHMKASGFNFCDYEPAPFDFPDKHKQDFNYGVYSARYCNIYTVRQLLQTFDRAYDKFSPVDDIWDAPDGQAYDAFRPAVEPGPFADRADLLAARASHLESCRRVFEDCDIFVFTLGLTEGWVSKTDGAVYPVCPGTIAGSFDSDQYEFRNFTFGEIYDDFLAFRERIKAVNPTVKFILTVSPVPLTATRSDDHIAVATSYSKSVLRAVAGQLCQEYGDVDYFPSYEIIASPVMRGMFFEPNMRSVNPAGVTYVMTHFFAQHDPNKGQAAKPMAGPRTPSAIKTGDDVACEEMLMEQTFK